MIKAKAYAKLNLNLHLLPEKLETGLYPVKFINCQMDLYDELIFKEIKNEIQMICDNSEVPKGKDNLVYKAAYLLKQYAGKKDLGIEITLKKNIPIKAGLGGGSADAACTIDTLIKLWNIKIKDKELFTIISQLGKDVFYSLKGGVCSILGDGTIVDRLNLKMPQLYLLIVAPDEKKPSTGWMYQKLDLKELGRNLEKFTNIQTAIKKKDKKEIIKNLYNEFDEQIGEIFPKINAVKKDILFYDAERAMLAGSGLSIVGFFQSKEKAKKALDNLKIKYKKIIWTKTI